MFFCSTRVADLDVAELVQKIKKGMTQTGRERDGEKNRSSVDRRSAVVERRTTTSSVACSLSRTRWSSDRALDLRARPDRSISRRQNKSDATRELDGAESRGAINCSLWCSPRSSSSSSEERARRLLSFNRSLSSPKQRPHGHRAVPRRRRGKRNSEKKKRRGTQGRREKRPPIDASCDRRRRRRSPSFSLSSRFFALPIVPCRWSGGARRTP